MIDGRCPTSSAAPLSGRVVLVTGASSGIGRAIAIAAARAGADVAADLQVDAGGGVRETVARSVRSGGGFERLPGRYLQ